MSTRWIVLWIACFIGGHSVAAENATAILKETTEGSQVSGTATLQDTPQGLQISIQVAHVSPGQHGLHIHQYGRCEDEGKAAGGHYNPDGSKHGFLPTDGFGSAHAGDLGNIDVRGDGVGTLALTVHGLRLSGGPYTVGGRSIVLHETADDFGQPTGNAGGRIGCGIIRVTSH